MRTPIAQQEKQTSEIGKGRQMYKVWISNLSRSFAKKKKKRKIKGCDIFSERLAGKSMSMQDNYNKIGLLNLDSMY